MKLSVGVMTVGALFVFSEQVCEGPYPGYPCCEQRMNWMHDYHTTVGVKDDPCEWQMFLHNESNWCPTPGYRIPNDLAPSNFKPDADGIYTLLAYRAVDSNDKYGTALLNDDAADHAGVLSYLHSEVVPVDQHNEPFKTECQRRNNINSIMVFEVKIKPSPKVMARIPPLGTFVAYQAGKCDAGPAICEKVYTVDGNTPGFQSQESNKRANYGDSSYWYSFPKEGYCGNVNKTVPDGTMNCTFTYELKGKVQVDRMVYLENAKTINGSLNSYHEYCLANGQEFTRKSQSQQPGQCETVYDSTRVVFWDEPCNITLSQVRIEALLNATLVPPASIPPPFDRQCASAAGPTPAPGGGDSGWSSLTKNEQVAIVIGGIIGGLAVLGGVVYCMRRKRHDESNPLLSNQF